MVQISSFNGDDSTWILDTLQMWGQIKKWNQESAFLPRMRGWIFFSSCGAVLFGLFLSAWPSIVFRPVSSELHIWPSSWLAFVVSFPGRAPSSTGHRGNEAWTLFKHIITEKSDTLLHSFTASLCFSCLWFQCVLLQMQESNCMGFFVGQSIPPSSSYRLLGSAWCIWSGKEKCKLPN